MSIPPFIAFASHPALRQRFCEARAMLAFEHPDGPVIWANAAGAKLFGYGSPSDAIGAPLSDQVTRRQFIAAAEGLQQPGDRKNLTIHVAHHFKRVAKQASTSLFMLGGKRCLLLDCESENYDEDSLITGPDDLNLALVDSDGRITLGSDALPSSVLESADIGQMAADLRADGESYTQRLITDETGIWPVALGWLSNSPPLFLLSVSPQRSHAVEPDRQPRPSAQAATPPRAARDVIAAIDESLAALPHEPRRDDGTVSAVVRKQPRQELPQAEISKPQQTLPQAEKHDMPLRFIWRTDIDGRITEVSGELVEAVGQQTGAISGLTFAEIESQLGVTGAGAIGGLLSGAETWSGRTVEWPVSGSDMLVPVDLAALPTFTRERHFDGFRGFGLVRLDEQHRRPEPVRTAIPEPAAPEPPISRPAERPATLTDDERFALSEIANRLRSENPDEMPSAPPEKPAAVIRRTTALPVRQKQASDLDTARFAASEDAVVVQSGERVLYANPAFLTLSGYASLDAVIAAGGTDAFVERGSDDRLFLRTARGDQIPVSFHMQAISWNGGRALALTLRPEDEEPLSVSMPVISHAADIESMPSPVPETEAGTEAQVAELSSMLDTATDGILILDGERRIRSLSASASALFATDTAEVAGEPVDILFAGESHGDIEAQLDRLQRERTGNVGAEGLEVIGRESGGGLIPLFVTFGRLPQSSGICMVLRDITALKRRDDDLRAARRDARQAEDARDDFVSALRYEVRQPLDAIVSLSETMDHQAFGTIGDTRYHAIAREIASKGRQARSVIGRLLGEPEPEPAQPAAPLLATAQESEKQPLKAEATRINDAIAEAVSMVQPRANSRRIIIRAALSPSIGNAQGSFETLKEIAHELLLGAVQFTPAGGQVVVSTALTPEGGTVLRFRDNGIAPSRRRAGHGGARPPASEPDNSHLARARALAESLGARLVMQGIPNEGMLVEVFLPERQARPLSH